MENKDPYTHYYDAEGNLTGVLLSPDAWQLVQKQLTEAFDSPQQNDPKPVVEPLKDWETLVQFWDFKYPVDYDVACELCGSSTDNWQNDSPKKFYLKAASLGGLVSFHCVKCNAKIIKRHFKKHIAVETVPFQKDKKMA